ncbi:uncharacterized protein [Dysidea avara]|uniref:uncharacterized protein n=1 Tax=Dysidea avara TaxID=196820 RepID=UPI00331B35D2
MGEISCHDCPQEFMCGGNISFPRPIIAQPTTCSNGYIESWASNYIIFYTFNTVSHHTTIVSMARLRKVVAAENNKTVFASRTGNITMNMAYQPFNKDQRFDKDQVFVNHVYKKSWQQKITRQHIPQELATSQ